MLVIELSWTAENGLKTSLYPGVSTYKIRDSCQTFIEQNTARLVDANISFKPYGILHSFPHLGKRFTYVLLCDGLPAPTHFSYHLLQGSHGSICKPWCHQSKKNFFTTLISGEVGGVNSTFTFFFFMKFSVATLVCRQAFPCSIFSLCFFRPLSAPFLFCTSVKLVGLVLQEFSKGEIKSESNYESRPGSAAAMQW